MHPHDHVLNCTAHFPSVHPPIPLRPFAPTQEFTESKSHRPNVFQQVSYFVRRVSTLNRGLGP